MDAETIDKILELAKPYREKIDEFEYCSEHLQIIAPPQVLALEVTSLRGLADLFDGSLDEISMAEVFVHLLTPTKIEVIDRSADNYGRRRIWISAQPRPVQRFPFGQWQNVESFLISAQCCFQRVKIEKDDGTLAKDIDYVLKIASGISHEEKLTLADDGISQQAAINKGIALKEQAQLRSRVNLAPYRTFLEVDQPVSEFVFRAREWQGSIQLALFEADGGGWQLTAVRSIFDWLTEQITDVLVIE